MSWFSYFWGSETHLEVFAKTFESVAGLLDFFLAVWFFQTKRAMHGHPTKKQEKRKEKLESALGLITATLVIVAVFSGWRILTLHEQSEDTWTEKFNLQSNELASANHKVSVISNQWHQTKSDLLETRSKLDAVEQTASEAHEMASSSNVVATLAKAEYTAAEAATIAQNARNNAESKFAPRGISDNKLIYLTNSFGNLGNGRNVWFVVDSSIPDSEDFGSRLNWVLVNSGFKFAGTHSSMMTGVREFEKGIWVELWGEPNSPIVDRLINGFNSIGIPAKKVTLAYILDVNGNPPKGLYIWIRRP